MSLYQYQDDFFAYQQVGSLASAKSIVPLMLKYLKTKSVLDVGCGAGAWVLAYLESGVADVVGVDAEYVQEEQLLFDGSKFRAIDITKPFRLQRSFDLVQCLEVAEHLAPAASETLVDNLVAHAPVVVFSAAPPGQGGEHHINERSYEFWRQLFANRDYLCFDFIRPMIRLSFGVESWYRYNMMLFVQREAVDSLHPSVRMTLVQPEVPVQDISPLIHRVRKKILSLLPSSAITQLASLKHRVTLLRRRFLAAPR